MENNILSGSGGFTIIELIRLFKKNVYLILSVLILICLLGLTYTFKVSRPVYKSSSTIMVQVTASEEINNTSDITNALRIVTTVSEFITNDTILEKVSKSSNISVGDLRGGLSVNYTINSLNVVITYRSIDKDTAVIVPNLIMKEAQIEANVKVDDEDGFEKYKFAVIANTISIVSESTVATQVSLSKIAMMILFIALGLVLAVSIVVFKEIVNTRIQDCDEIERKYGVKVIGMVPSYEIKGRKKYA